ncbi:MAG: septum formation inhibitor Maf [Betaproteobacteria bacterium]|nr:septum formation inhibitor Maf [Betaproteobacteria bacterium]
MQVLGDWVYLASRSPRRRELLTQIGIGFEMLLLREGNDRAPDVDETPRPGEPPDHYVMRVSRDKAAMGWRRLVERRLPRLPVLAADTTVCLGDRILGKPADRAEAATMLAALSGREHRVLTAVAIQFDAFLETAVSESVVRFDALDEAMIAAYVATGEPMDKAGAYGIQGRAAAFIAELRGSFSGVMGLPLYETATLLRHLRKKL